MDMLQSSLHMTSHDFRALSIDKQEVTVDADYTQWEDNQYSGRYTTEVSII